MKLQGLALNSSIWSYSIQQLSINHLAKRFTCKIAVEVDKEVLAKLEAEEIKPRHHPGVCKAGHLTVPRHIANAIVRCIGDRPAKALLRDGNALSTYFHARHPPPEPEDIRSKVREIEKELNQKSPFPDLENLSEEEVQRLKYVREQKAQRLLKQRLFNWKPMTYGAYESLSYAVGRSAQEFAVLSSIFTEISARHPDFKPRSYIDFGSGVGSGMWAATNVWKDSIFEFFNVDSSRDMNDLSEMILRGGKENQEMRLKNVFYRQFLPSQETKYDLVVMAFSLFELPGEQSRKEVLLNLWKKCDGYLVIVEDGTRSAFNLVNEARDYILSTSTEEDPCHVFAPCPHDLTCPRTANPQDKTPCNFEVSYEPLGIGEKITSNRTARYTYVVIKKGQRSGEGAWPRIIRPTLVRSKHTVCRMCTSSGNLQEIIFTKSKHGKFAYRCARSSRWGNRLPIEIGEKYTGKKHEYEQSKNEKVQTES